MGTTIGYRPEIDGLRAVAVVAVILNHFDSAITPSGYLGVDVFFVISGYVISRSLCTRESTSLASLVIDFYARRFKRLLPALVVVVVVNSILISLFSPNPIVALKTGFSSIFGLSNLYLLRNSLDYFGSQSQLNIFTHTWSLGVEEQFYLVFPLIAWFLLVKRSPSDLSSFHIVMIAAVLLSLATFIYFFRIRPPFSFYLSPLRFWELGVGCLVAARHLTRPPQIPTRSGRLASIILLLIVAAMFTPRALALPANIVVVFLTAALISIIGPGSAAYAGLTCSPATYIGRISYSLYLWHWPVLVLSRWTIGVHLWTVPLQVVVMWIAAHQSYHRIESPFRHRKWALTPGRTVFAGLSTMVAAGGLVAVLFIPLNGRLYVGHQAQLALRGVASLSYPYEIPGTLHRWSGRDCVLSENSDVGKVLPIEGCTLGEFQNAPHRVMVFGNSFSAAFVHGFDDIVKTGKYSVTITSSWGASPIRNMPNGTIWSEANDFYWSDIVPSMIRQLRTGDFVFLISDLADLSPEQISSTSTYRLNLFAAEVRRFSEELRSRGVRVLILHGNPFIRDANCVPEAALPQWFAPDGGPCKILSKRDTLGRRQAVDVILKQLEQEQLLDVVDLIDLFCPGLECTYVGSHGQVLYRDEYSHPSAEAVRQAAPLIRQVLETPSEQGIN